MKSKSTFEYIKLVNWVRASILESGYLSSIPSLSYHTNRFYIFIFTAAGYAMGAEVLPSNSYFASLTLSKKIMVCLNTV